MKTIVAAIVLSWSVNAHAVTVTGKEIENIRVTAKALAEINVDRAINVILNWGLKAVLGVAQLPSGTETIEVTPARAKLTVSTEPEDRSLYLRLIHANNTECIWADKRNELFRKTKALTKRDAALLSSDPTGLSNGVDAIANRDAGARLRDTKLEY